MLQGIQRTNYLMDAMTLPQPNPSVAWDRTLPKPQALLQESSREFLGFGRSASLLHSSSNNITAHPALESARRNTAPCLQYRAIPHSPIQQEAACIDPRLRPIADSSGTDLTKKRDSSQMADDLDSGEQSPTTSSPSATGSASQYCLCQRDPKIPRPRNGMSLSPMLVTNVKMMHQIGC